MGFHMNIGCRDGVHLSAEGSKIVVKEILKVLSEAKWEPSLLWNSLPSEFAEDSAYDPLTPDRTRTFNVADIDSNPEKYNF